MEFSHRLASVRNLNADFSFPSNNKDEQKLLLRQLAIVRRVHRGGAVGCACAVPLERFVREHIRVFRNAMKKGTCLRSFGKTGSGER
jgi:hypothetical protein